MFSFFFFFFFFKQKTAYEIKECDWSSDVCSSDLVMFGFGELPQSVLETLKDFALHKIGSLGDAAWDKIRGELTLGMLGLKTPHEVMQSIIGAVDKPSIFGDRKSVV